MTPAPIPRSAEERKLLQVLEVPAPRLEELAGEVFEIACRIYSNVPATYPDREAHAVRVALVAAQAKGLHS